MIQGFVDGIHIHLYNMVAFEAKKLVDLVFQIGNGVFHRDHIGQFKKGGLHDHVNAAAQTHFRCYGNGVNIIKFQPFLSDGAFDMAG